MDVDEAAAATGLLRSFLSWLEDGRRRPLPAFLLYAVRGDRWGAPPALQRRGSAREPHRGAVVVVTGFAPLMGCMPDEASLFRRERLFHRVDRAAAEVRAASADRAPGQARAGTTARDGSVTERG